jgi:hypothetical protein
LQRGGVFDGLDQIDRAVDLADGAFHLRMAGMADEDDFAALRGVAAAFGVDFGHQRAGGVDDGERAAAGGGFHFSGHAVGGEDGHRTFGHLVQFVHEYGAAGA